MKVAELLTLMGTLSVGNDNITPTERAIFLQYLNLAHLELYQGTANFNQDLLVKEVLTTQEGLNTVTLSKMPYLVSSVYDATHKQPLKRLAVAEASDPAYIPQGTPQGYCMQKAILSFIPVATVPAQTSAVSVVVWYIPQPSAFTEATEEKDIPYPLAYHPVLVDGGLYYLFQEEGGFKSSHKENEAKARWETGKSKLLSYLHSSGGQTFSTFSSA